MVGKIRQMKHPLVMTITQQGMVGKIEQMGHPLSWIIYMIIIICNRSFGKDYIFLLIIIFYTAIIQIV